MQKRKSAGKRKLRGRQGKVQKVSGDKEVERWKEKEGKEETER